ncbi:13394_t:CDS:2 [Entrophospora sp. SA101]|nr:13390_t:CDS:2 [Entrophospora sp. SA101]CAJ0631909.1 13394_t:CDS:2 [Entrophospora sp. SA101]
MISNYDTTITGETNNNFSNRETHSELDKPIDKLSLSSLILFYSTRRPESSNTEDNEFNLLTTS